MALARIITRSQACSRELALDLLARGYTVEIVSPDKIPDNIADLELRVDAGPGDQLTAKVETHDGDHSSTLDFVHHLKAPMGDFVRRPRGLSGELVPLSNDSDAENVGVTHNTFQNREDASLVVLPRNLAPISTAVITLRESLDQADVRPLSPPILSALPAVEIAAHIAAPAVDAGTSVVEASSAPAKAEPAILAAASNRATITTRAFEPRVPLPNYVVRSSGPSRNSSSQRFGRSLFRASSLRAVITLASIVVLALILAFGLRRPGKTAAQSPATTAGGSVSASIADVHASNSTGAAKDPQAKDPQTEPSPNTRPVSEFASRQALAPGNDSARVSRIASAAKNEPKIEPKIEDKIVPAATSVRVAASTKHSNDSVAPNTVTYLDQRYKPALSHRSVKYEAAKKTRPHSASVRHDGVAANTVIYLDHPLPPQPAK
jgi:hypothetical protein